MVTFFGGIVALAAERIQNCGTDIGPGRVEGVGEQLSPETRSLEGNFPTFFDHLVKPSPSLNK